MMVFENGGMAVARRALERDAPMKREEMAAREAALFFASDRRRWMEMGRRYYRGEHDIRERRRLGVGPDGQRENLTNLANNRLKHPFLRELVEQKCQYLLGKPFAWRCGDGELDGLLGERIDQGFRGLLMGCAKDSIVAGIGWIHLYYDEGGRLGMQRMRPEEMIPLWADGEHSRLDAMLRCYQREEWLGRRRRVVDCVCLWDKEGVWHYRREGGALRQDESLGSWRRPDFWHWDDGERRAGRWGRLPFVPVRYNDEEQPLLALLKSLIDEYDKAASDFANALEDQPNSILVLKNYDGQDLGEFRRNLAAYRAVKVSDDGGVDSLSSPLDHGAVSAQLDRLRRDIYALGRGIDHRSGRIQAAASGVALKYEYAALDMDANGMERHLQVALDQLVDFWVEDAHRQGRTEIFKGDVDFVFNRDIIVNEMEAIEMVRASEGLLDREVLLANHPWV